MTTVGHRSGHRPAHRKPAQVSVPGWGLWTLVVLNAIAATALFMVDGGTGNLTVAGLMTALGHLSGLYGALGLALQLVLIARVPWLEQRLGMDRLTVWHRWSGFAVLWLLVTHVVFAPWARPLPTVSRCSPRQEFYCLTSRMSLRRPRRWCCWWWSRPAQHEQRGDECATRRGILCISAPILR